MLVKLIEKNLFFRIIFGIVVIVDLYFRSGSNEAGSFFYFGIPGSFIMMFALFISVIFIIIDFIMILNAAFRGLLINIIPHAIFSFFLVCVVLFQAL